MANILTVGVGKQYATVSAAIAAAQNGDTVAVDAGTYTNDTATINTRITLKAVGGIVNMVETQPLANKKGILVVNADATIQGFSFSGAAISAADGNNGAGIRYQAGNLTLRNDYFTGNQNGLLATPNVAGTGTINIQNSEFNANGAGDGYSHNIYVGDVASFTFNNSYSHDAIVGHDIKSRAENTTITNSRIMDGATGSASYAIDLPNGGNATISNNVIQQGAYSQNPAIIAYGEEGNLRANSALSITGNTIVNQLTAHTPLGVNNAAASVTATLTNNRIYGLADAQIVQGNAVVSGTTVLANPPLPNTANVWRGSYSHTLTVGVGKQYATVSAAIAAAKSGDTVAVDAGTYTNDTATINASITLKAIGGVVNMVATQPLANKKGILVVNADATIVGFSFSGAAISAADGNNGAGIRYQAGNLTLRNDYFTGNQNGLLATPGVAGTGTIDIGNSEFNANGAGDGYSHNIYVNDVASFSFINSYSHDANVGHDLKSRAENTFISNSRIEDGANATASYTIDLPNGGNATIRNSVIQQGPNSQNGIIVAYGEEGNLRANSALVLSGNTIVNDLTAHTPLGVSNQAPGVTASLKGNRIYGLAAGQVVQGSATITSQTTLANRPVLDLASHWQPVVAPVTAATVAVASMAFMAPTALAAAPAAASETTPAPDLAGHRTHGDTHILPASVGPAAHALAWRDSTDQSGAVSSMILHSAAVGHDMLHPGH